MAGLGMTLDEFWQRQAANRQGLLREQQTADALPEALAPRQALEAYRNLSDQGFSHDQIERAFGRRGWAMPPAGVIEEFTRAVKRGAMSSAGAGLEGLGSLTGSQGLMEAGQGLEAGADDPSLVPGVADYTDIRGPSSGGIGRTVGDTARYVAGMVGQTLPESAAIMAAGTAAALGAPAAPLVAGGAAAFGTAFLPTLGRHVEEQIDRGAAPEDVMIGGEKFAQAAGSAAAAASLDSILATRIAGLITRGAVRAAAPSTARRILREVRQGQAQADQRHGGALVLQQEGQKSEEAHTGGTVQHANGEQP